METGLVGVGIIRDKRKFGGKMFSVDGSWPFYGAAQAEANILREKGYNVRITEAKGYRGRVSYITWKRRKGGAK